ncbi:MAG: single-stranded DNA-binding protein [Planctomycetia bacterium]|nr:single-stranded DNA-binding protein [Planctomycetia bacterium]
MASYNRVVLVGNLTRDPDLRYTPTGTPVCEIGLAVNERRKSPDGEWVDETTFIDITLWQKTAETCSQYMQKGSQVLIEGRLKLDTWEQEGQKRSKLRVIGDRMVMLGSRGDRAAGGVRSGREESEAYGGGGYGDYSQAPSRPASAQQSQPPVDDIPF